VSPPRVRCRVRLIEFTAAESGPRASDHAEQFSELAPQLCAKPLTGFDILPNPPPSGVCFELVHAATTAPSPKPSRTPREIPFPVPTSQRAQAEGLPADASPPRPRRLMRPSRSGRRGGGGEEGQQVPAA
jgi:hypothetical protein